MITTLVGEALSFMGWAKREQPEVPELFRQDRRHIDLFPLIEAHSDPAGALLDVGCGDGRLPRVLHDRGWTDLNGCDWRAPADLASMPWLRFNCCDLNAGGLEQYSDQAFHTVICSEVLEHVENPAAVLRHISRILTPAGRCVITLPNACNFFERLVFLATGNSTRYRSERQSGPWSHISFFTSETLESLLDRGDLVVVAEGTSAIFWGGYFFFPNYRFSRLWSYSASWVVQKQSPVS